MSCSILITPSKGFSLVSTTETEIETADKQVLRIRKHVENSAVICITQSLVETGDGFGWG